MNKLSILLIAALLTILAINSTKTAKADVELTINCNCQSPTPSSSLTPSPIPTETPLICPNDYHLNASGKKCVQFELGGAPPPPANQSQVLAASTTTLASTGTNETVRLILAIITSGVIFSVIKKYNI